jgi:hypothetical protein
MAIVGSIQFKETFHTLMIIPVQINLGEAAGPALLVYVWRSKGMELTFPDIFTSSVGGMTIVTKTKLFFQHLWFLVPQYGQRVEVEELVSYQLTLT